MDARLRGASRVAGAVAVCVGVAVLLSWLLGVSPYRALFPARVSMVPSAALGAVLLGVRSLVLKPNTIDELCDIIDDIAARLPARK
jgi:hypothetical protein